MSRKNHHRNPDGFQNENRSTYEPPRGDADVHAYDDPLQETRGWPQPNGYTDDIESAGTTYNNDARQGRPSESTQRGDRNSSNQRTGYSLNPGYSGQNTRSAQSGRSGSYQSQQAQQWETDGGYAGESEDSAMRAGNPGFQRRYGIPDQRGSMQGPVQRGVPPRSYKRTDERILEDVCERLMDEGLDCGGVDVVVQDRVVTITGEVSDRQDKLRIEQTAASVSGVEDIDNKLKIVKNHGKSGSNGGAATDRADASAKNIRSQAGASTGISAAATRG